MGHPVLLLYKVHRFCVLAVTRNESDRQGGRRGGGHLNLHYVQSVL
jgi:hypothetical protein